MSGFLSKKQREELLEELSLERKRRYADRIRIILLLDEGKKQKDIAEYLFLNETTITNYKRRYEKGGIECLINDNYNPKKCFLTDKELKELSRVLASKPFSTAKAVILYIEKTFGVRYSVGGVTELLHRLKFSYKKATAVPGKAKREEQEKFIRKYVRLQREKGVFYFADSTHPEWGPTISYAWIKEGKKFEVKTNSGWRKRVNLYGVIEIKSLETVMRTSPTVNQLNVREMLYVLRKKHPKEKNLYVFLDGAGYNRARSVKELARNLKIKIVYLPPYSPNLNPIERLWKFMKKNVTANRYYENYDDFKESLSQFCRNLRHRKPELRTLITDNFSVLGT